MINKTLFRKDLVNWFKASKRDLPWRKNRTPYRVWVSEIMLQQTQVKTVIPYYNRWMKKLPALKHLAEADEETLHALWQGLGYYSRVRNLKKGALTVLKDYEGIFPRTTEELIKIPGIGPYTAGAIASLAFDVKAPIVDGNVSRVLSRVLNIADCVDDSKVQKKIYTLEASFLPDKGSGAFNEAMMELGALICMPNDPACAVCPVQKHCTAFKSGKTAELPVKKKRQKTKKVKAIAVALRHKNRYLLQKRPVGEIMGGLWEFPEKKMSEASGEKKLLHECRKLIGDRSINIEHLDKIKRSYTYFQETLYVYTAESDNKTDVLETSWQTKWLTPGQMDQVALSSAHSKIKQLLQKRG